ncbi:MAG: methyltransferase [Syntrophobacteria bacterium]
MEALLKVSGSFWHSCTLHAAVELEIFTIIGDGQLRAEEVAGRLAADVRGVTMLLNAATAMGLLVRNGSRYGNSSASKSLLAKDSPDYIGYIIQHHHHLVNGWSQLPEAVRTGKPVRSRFSQSSEKERESFLMGMYNLAMGIAPKVAAQIDLIGKRHLLDLGGGPGTYAAHFCQTNPQLRATIYDLPSSRPFALETVERFAVTERIAFVAGDYLHDELPGSYDVAWLSHILHGEGPEDCEKIIDKSVSALEAGGLILVHDFILNDTMDGPLFPALFALNMLVNTPRGQAYSEAQIREMLRNAGVREITRLPFQGPNDSGILQGVV